MIEKATRITKTSQTLIDLVFTNKADRIGLWKLMRTRGSALKKVS